MNILLSIMLSGILALANVGTVASNEKQSMNYTSEPYVATAAEYTYTPFPYQGIEPIYRYEPNDIWDSATNLCPPEYYELNSYHTNLKAALDTAAQIQDRDFYYFTLLTDCNVTVRATTDNPNYSFNFHLTQLTYTPASGDKVSKRMKYLYEEETTQKTKYFNSTLKAGTYYIYFMCQQPFNSNITVEYDLDLYVSKAPAGKDADIRDLRVNKELSGAVWLSDYLPLGIENVFDPTLDVTYQANKTGLSEPDYALDDLMELSGGNKIHVATLYIWSPELRYCINQALSEVSEILINEFLEEDEIRVELEAKHNKIENTITITGAIIKVGGLTTPFSKIITGATLIIQTIAESTLNLYFDAITPKISVDKAFYLAYIQRLKGTVDILYDFIEDSDGNIMYKKFRNNNEVIAIPYYYNLSKTSNAVTKLETHNISFKPSINEILLSETLLYNENIIPVVQNDVYCCRGKIFGFEGTEFKDLKQVDEYDDIEPILTEIEVNGALSADYNKGEYQWYQFTAPTYRTYYFYALGIDTPKVTIDVFRSVVKGYSDSGIVARYTEEFVAKVSGHKGCGFSRYMPSGETLYFRVSGENYEALNSSVAFQVKTEPYEMQEHEHENVYQWLDGKTHKYICKTCYEVSFTQNHTVKRGTDKCSVCGGTVSFDHEHTYVYEWANGTHHNYACSQCGFIKSTEAHTVKNGSNKCFRCGGIVDKGIIEFSAMCSTYEDVCILPNKEFDG